MAKKAGSQDAEKHETPPPQNAVNELHQPLGGEQDIYYEGWTPAPQKTPVDTKPTVFNEEDIPTPCVGMVVQHWAQRDEREEPTVSAAVVTRIELPGVVTLSVFPIMGDPRTRVGVPWRFDLTKPGPQRRERGTWDYIPGTPKNDDRFDLHRKVIAKMKRQLGLS